MSDSENYDESGPTPEETRRVRQRVEGLFRDVLRRTVSQGAGARQLTEETVRSLVNEMKLPREIAAFTLQQADTIKSEVVRVVAGEVRNFLEEANLGEELAKILTSLSFEVRTEIRFIPNDEALKPNVRSRIGVKTDRGEKIVEDAQSEEIDNAIRSTVTSLATRLLSRVVGAEEEEGESADPDTLAEQGIGPAASSHQTAGRSVSQRSSDSSASAKEKSASVQGDAGQERSDAKGKAAAAEKQPAAAKKKAPSRTRRTRSAAATSTKSKSSTTKSTPASRRAKASAEEPSEDEKGEA